MSDVFVVMGSDNDWSVVRKACEVLKAYGVSYTARVLSAHRTPALLEEAIREAERGGVKVYIAAAGMAAHLAGVVASQTLRPVIGIPVSSGTLGGEDALLAMSQMPPGVPVGCVGIDGAMNAGLLAVQILSVADAGLHKRLVEERKVMAAKIMEKDAKLQRDLP